MRFSGDYPGADDAAVDRAAAKSDRVTSRAKLIDGLIGGRVKLYHNNAHFYHSINALADMLPYWVDGIAAEAERRSNPAPTRFSVPEDFDPPGVRYPQDGV